MSAVRSMADGIRRKRRQSLDEKSNAAICLRAMSRSNDGNVTRNCRSLIRFRPNSDGAG
jgi:hypothetical protein